MFDPRRRERGFFFNRHRWDDAAEPNFDFPFGQFGPFGRRGGRWGQGERHFGRGDLKIVILELLKDQPRHGYDIIRALEERSRGTYRPSPGSVYPTLQMLEDLGYVSSTQEEGKKVYAITDEGRRFLADQESTADDIRSRIFAGWDAAQRPEVAELMREAQGLARALFRQAGRGAFGDPERLKKLRAIVERARQEVDALENTPTPSSTPSTPPTTMV